jgi:ATP dependent DNA ligase-like protein
MNADAKHKLIRQPLTSVRSRANATTRAEPSVGRLERRYAVTSGGSPRSSCYATAGTSRRRSSTAFDLLELDGDDPRREPIEVRKATLASILRKSRHGVRLNEHLEHPDGLTVFQHACKMGLDGIVSKRLGSRYRPGRSPDWLEFKNPAAPAVKPEAEEDWGR